MSDDYTMHIEQAANGCCGGKLSEWPVLHEALKRRGHTLPPDAGTLEVKAICKLECEIASLKRQLVKAEHYSDFWRRRLSEAADEYDEVQRRLDVSQARVERLEGALQSVYVQAIRGIRCGIVQPVTVADCEELNAASRQAREALKPEATTQERKGDVE